MDSCDDYKFFRILDYFLCFCVGSRCVFYPDIGTTNGGYTGHPLLDNVTSDITVTITCSNYSESDSVSDTLIVNAPIPGCTDVRYASNGNYNVNATMDDGSCACDGGYSFDGSSCVADPTCLWQYDNTSPNTCIRITDSHSSCISGTDKSSWENTYGTAIDVNKTISCYVADDGEGIDCSGLAGGVWVEGYGTRYRCNTTPTPPQCTGLIPSNASRHDSEEESGLSANTSWEYANPDTARKCEFECNTGYEWDGNSCEPDILGCTNPAYSPNGNYDPSATISDTCSCNSGYTWTGSSCEILGCMNANYSPNGNYNLSATQDDGSCACDAGYTFNGSSCVLTVTPVDGVCGASLDTCTDGAFSDRPDTATTYEWSCLGQNGGNDALNCSLPIPPGPVDGTCGGTVDTCVDGTYSDRSDTATTYEWSCLGQNGGNDDLTCSAPIPPAPVDGVCGGSVDTCSDGSYSDRADTATTYEWSCLGENGGNDDLTCSALIPTGNITGNDCVILIGDDHCTVSADWSSSAITDPQIRLDGLIKSVNPAGNSAATQDIYTGPGFYTYTLQDGASVIAQDDVEVTCETGSDWNVPGGFCEPVGGTPPATPAGISASPACAPVPGINVSWTAVANADDYMYRRYIWDGSTWLIDGIGTTMDPQVTDFDTAGIVEGEQYRYSVRAGNVFGNSSFSALSSPAVVVDCGGAGTPSCGATEILDCQLDETLEGETDDGVCVRNTWGTCSYTCDAAPNTWSESTPYDCKPLTVTFEICDDGGGNCVSTGVKTVNKNTPLDVIWSSPDATRCDEVTANFSTGGLSVGSDDVVSDTMPATDEVFTIRCERGSAQVASSITVRTNADNPDITGAPRIVETGGTTNLTITRNGSTGCLLNGGEFTDYPISDTDPVTNINNVVIEANTTFTVTCSEGTTDSVNIEVITGGYET